MAFEIPNVPRRRRVTKPPKTPVPRRPAPRQSEAFSAARELMVHDERRRRAFGR